MTPFLPRSVKDLAEEVPEAPEWLVHGLLPKGTLGLLAAYPKVGKSTLAYQVAVAVAQDREFLGCQTHPGGVLIIVAEEREDDAMRRLREFGMTETDPIWLWTETVADTPADQPKIRQFITERGIALIIIDTFATYLMLQDETDNSAVTRRLKPYVDMAHTTGTTILFVHHERKNRDEGGGNDTRAIRGGSAILGLADLAFQLQKEAGGGTRRRLNISGRYQEIPRSFELDYRDDEYISLGPPEEHTRAAHRRRVLAALPTDGPGLTAKEVATKTGLKEKAARTALEDAHNHALATRSGAGRKGDPFRYWRVSESADTPTLVPAIGDTNEKEIAEV
jgi:hypothetical protein